MYRMEVESLCQSDICNCTIIARLLSPATIRHCSLFPPMNKGVRQTQHMHTAKYYPVFNKKETLSYHKRTSRIHKWNELRTKWRLPHGSLSGGIWRSHNESRMGVPGADTEWQGRKTVQLDGRNQLSRACNSMNQSVTSLRTDLTHEFQDKKLNAWGDGQFSYKAITISQHTACLKAPQDTP